VPSRAMWGAILNTDQSVARLLANRMEMEVPMEGHNMISWFCKGPQVTFWESWNECEVFITS